MFTPICKCFGFLLTFFLGMAGVVVLLQVSVTFAKRTTSKPPHIVFIFADDMGWDDVSFHGSSQIPTPNIDALAADGIILDDYYVQPMCTPSRAALMTGLYPIHTGMQHWVIRSAEPWGLPLELKILPEHMKDLGYSTHLVGKWHLGYFEKEYTPTYRGFDSFYGYYNGYIDYYSHTNEHRGHVGMDFRSGNRILRNETGMYATTLFTEKAVSIIHSHDQSKPLFLYLSHLAPHGASDKARLQAPDENVNKFPYIGEKNRTLYAGMVDALDESVGEVVAALFDAGMLHNTILVFCSDNGGIPFGFRSNRGFNWPLRGTKQTVWEGGVKVPAFIWSPLLPKRRRVSRQMMHITDWLPTLYASAGGDPRRLGRLDGYNMWDALSKGWRSPRTEVLLNIDPVTGVAGLRHGKHKLVISNSNTTHNTHVRTTGNPRPTNDLDELTDDSLAADVLRQFYDVDDLAFKPLWRQASTTECYRGKCAGDSVSLAEQIHLFDVEMDPCELCNLANTRKGTLRSLYRILEGYVATMLPLRNKVDDPKSYPENRGGVWETWQ